MGILSLTYKNKKSAFCFLLVLFLPLSIFSQTVIMPVTGQADTTMAYAELYDDGGPSSPHSSMCNAKYTFHTVNSLGHYRIEVQSFLTHSVGNARLTVYNGDANSGATMCTFPSYGMGGVYHSSGNTVTVSFVADDDIPTQGFKIILCEYDNDVVISSFMSYMDSNTLRIQWYGRRNNTTWIVDWAVVCENVIIDTFFANPANYNSDTLNTGEFYVYDIPVGCWVVYNIYANPVTGCSPSFAGNGPTYQTPFECPCYGPSQVNIVELEDSLIVSWVSDSVPGSWHLWTDYGNFDTVVPGTVNEITIPYDYPCTGNTLNFINDCDYFCNVAFFSLPRGGCMQTVGGINRGEITSTSIEILWNDADDSTTRYILSMNPHLSSTPTPPFLDTLPHGTTSYVFNGLEPLTDYIFQIRTLCADGLLGCTPSSNSFKTLMDNCIDYVNPYNSNQVVYSYGSYSNPMSSYGRQYGRHTVMTSLGQTDANTGGVLQCIPPGEVASFKLGDDNNGAKGETVTFNYFVDSVDMDMLVLKYAVVMQNPNHTSANQPRFTMEILDNGGNLIDSVCCYADFVAADNLGWNTVAGTNIIWKDWTTVGIDIARYHGQIIKIRFTTKDCADGGHFGYAYFTVHCDNKRIALVNLCESDDSVRLRAPLGFEYRWRRDDDSTVLSTENEIIVPADSSRYYCYATFIGRPECNFVVSSRAILPYPRADFEYYTDTCRQQIVLVNCSYVDIDSTYLSYVRQYVDSVYWVVDGNVSYEDTIVLDASTDTLFDVTLYCHLSQSICYDSLYRTVNVNVAHSHKIVGDTTACSGDTVRLVALMSPSDESSLLWYDASDDTSLFVAIDCDTNIYAVFNYKFCIDTVWHHIISFNTDDDTIVAQSCIGWLDTLGFNADSTGIYTLRLLNRFGCDSLITLNLTIHPSYFDTVAAITCGESYIDSEFNEDSSGLYTHAYTTVFGCDSIYYLDFYRHMLFSDTIYAEILYGDTYTFKGLDYDGTGEYQSIYADLYGCDSSYILNLNVIRLMFPNVVTPNGDGYNDILEIVGLLDGSIFDTPKIYVYNRWGRLVYKCENIQAKSDFWDPAKTDSPDGTYFYHFIVNTDNRNVTHNSAVEVVRYH